MPENDLIHRIAEDMLPLPVENFFTAQRAPDFWCGDELPPTFQAYLADPQVQQAKWLFRYQIAQAAAKSEEHAAQQAHAEALTRQGRAPRRRQ